MNDPLSSTQKSFDVAITDLVEGVKLPPQPKVIMAINREIQKDDPSFARISELISHDAALSAKVLKVVNSPYFSGGRNITSINTALSRLGLNNFFCVVLSSCLKDAMGVDEVTERLWDHTLLVAKLCEEIARKCRDVSLEQAYIAGLFHDASIPLLMQKHKSFIEVLEMTVARGGEIDLFEEQNFSTNHALISYLLARSWGLPEAVVNAIRFHHTFDLEAFTDEGSKTLGAILMLADHFSRVVAEENRETHYSDRAWDRVSPQVLAVLGLYEDDMADLQDVATEYAGRC